MIRNVATILVIGRVKINDVTRFQQSYAAGVKFLSCKGMRDRQAYQILMTPNSDLRGR